MALAKQLPLWEAPSPQHWRWFADFSRYELWAGGPDPHMKIMVAACADRPAIERLWGGACYIASYTGAGGMVFWLEWPWARYKREPDALLPWLREHWPQLLLHRHRRTVNSPERLAAYFVSYADWMRRADAILATTDYEVAWRSAMSILHVGRYMAIKLLEFLRLAGLTTVAIPDIRPRDGWSPRRGLAYLFPKEQCLYRKDDALATLGAINRLADLAVERLAAEHGVRLTSFQAEVFLCEYRQVYERGKQYPGKPLDSELAFMTRLATHWGDAYGAILAALRQRLFPAWALGELAGWPGVRQELQRVTTDHGYMWSDAVYDYPATTSVTQPVVRPTCLISN